VTLEKLSGPNTNYNSEMTDDEYDVFVRSKLLQSVDSPASSSVMPSTDLKLMENYLKQSYVKINSKESELLKEYLQYGIDLSKTKSIFALIIKGAKSKMTCKEWVVNKTEISPSSERRIRRMSRFVKEYPKLKHFSDSFTELFQMKGQ